MEFTPLCPLDGRYAGYVHGLRPFFTEDALIGGRVNVNTRYLIALSDEPNFSALEPFSEDLRHALDKISPLSLSDITWIKNKDAEIKHDAKAGEYFLRNKFSDLGINIPQQFIRFATTSEDDTNLAYGMLINQAIKDVIAPELYDGVINSIASFRAPVSAETALLGKTHGQPASPTSISEQMQVFEHRLRSKFAEVEAFSMHGKFGGAVGNLFAHETAYPGVNWQAFRNKFVKSLGLIPLEHTTQINPHDDLVRLCHIIFEINQILLKLAQDIWLYLSRHVLGIPPKEGEVGSSVMPHKVNPRQWELAESALKFSNGMFETFARELPLNRLQRDLSDSHMQRWLGCAFGEHLLAAKVIQEGFANLSINEANCLAEIKQHPEVYGEAIQTVMRRYGYTDAYEQLKELTRGKKVSAEILLDFIAGLEKVPEDAKQRLRDHITTIQ